MKFDNGKNRWDLVPFNVLDQMVEVITHGANKYDDNNWHKVDSERYFAALMRHISAWRQGEKCDKESRLHHLAHAVVNLVFLMELEKMKNDKGINNRD